MADEIFDPHYTWLGIRPEEQPPDHYRLIGLRQFEENADVIANAADRQMQFLRSMQVGKRSAQSQILLNEISTARGSLLDPERKAAYDIELKAKESAKAQAAKAAAAKAKPLPKAAALEPIPKPAPLTAKLPEPDLFSMPMPQSAYVAPGQPVRASAQPASNLPLIVGGAAGGIVLVLVVVIVVGWMLSGGKTVAVKPGNDSKGLATPPGTTSNSTAVPSPSPGENPTKTPTVPAVSSETPPTGAIPVVTTPPTSDWKPPTADSQSAFRCVLGTYMYSNDRAKTYPYVNLQVPRKNLWTPEIAEKTRGKVPYDEISYFGTAKIAVPANGTYVWDAEKSGRLQIDGKVVAEWDTPKGEITIAGGVHELIFEIGSHGGNWMRETNLGLKHKETGEEVPFFNTWKDIQKFLATPINGQSVTEVSGWQPTPENELQNYSQLLASAEVKGPTWQTPGPGDPVAFQSFLGSYMYWLDRKKTYPVVNLQVPNKNLWTDDVQIRGQGKASPDEISYIGTAKFAIPATGIYVLDTERVSRIRIDGQIAAEWDAPKGEITVNRGLHDLTVEVGSHGQPYVREYHFRLTRKETGEEIPMFNTWQDIQRFLNTPINGERVIEASGWQPEEKYVLKNYGELLASAGVRRPGVAVSHPAGPALPSPVYSWSFDEKSGDTADDTGGKGDAQGKNPIKLSHWAEGQPRFVPGRVGNALRFSQKEHYAATERYVDFPLITVAFWLKVLGEDGINPRIAHPWVELNYEKKAGIGVMGLVIEPERPEVGKWYHYVVGINQVTRQVAIFRDGVALKDTTLGEYESRKNAKFWAFGHNQDQNNASDSFHGEIDELKIYDQVLTYAEVAQLEAVELAKATGKEPAPGPTAVSADPVEKWPVPDAAALDKARKELVEVFGAEARAATTAEKKSELAKRMLQVAEDSQEDHAVQYALFDNARKLLVTAGDAEQALAAVDSLALQFEVDPWPLKVETASTLSDVNALPAARDQIASRLLAAVDEAISDQRFSAAEDFARLATKVSAKGKDLELRKTISQKRTDLARLKQHFAKVEEARAKLAADANDREANQVIGRFVALGVGDFENGIPYLAKGGDNLFVAAAAADVKASVLEKGAALAAADAWHKVAEAIKGDDKSASAMAMRRARDWYEAAAAETQGLEKARIEKRLKELQGLATTLRASPTTRPTTRPAPPRAKTETRPTRPTGRAKAVAGMVGRGFADNKDVNLFFIYHPGYKLTRDEIQQL
ncbi:MAG: hypothetical protein IAF94_25865, partial [Pirellulaceae bacterium]|nr:hypothetical protein [Pirellulaceae bacterium]